MLREKELFNNKCLFRYRPANENNISALRENKLFFSVPAYFNDPYDSLIFANTKQIVFSVVGDLNAELMAHEDHSNLAEPVNSFIKCICKNEKNKEKVLHHYYSLVIECLDHIRKQIRKNTRAICFSEEYDSMVMWAHYADDHKGYVMAFSRDDLVAARRFDEKK